MILSDLQTKPTVMITLLANKVNNSVKLVHLGYNNQHHGFKKLHYSNVALPPPPPVAVCCRCP